jgi:UrcA family protein
MLKSVFFRNIGFAAAIVALTANCAARAEQQTATRQVSLQGIDPASVADRARLGQQLTAAARDVCRETGNDDSREDMSDCVRASLESAWAQVNTKLAQAENRALIASSAR